MKSITRLAAGAAATICLFAGLASPANASTPLEAKIAQQAAQADLSKAQVADLQRKVDRQMDITPNGRQISVNQIAWDGEKTVMTFPLPGEKQARAVNEGVSPLGSPNCSYTYTCLYENQNFDGRRLSWRDCAFHDLSDFGFSDKTTSWHNNQTTGTKTYVYNWVGSWSLIWTSTAPSSNGNVGSTNNDKADGITVC